MAKRFDAELLSIPQLLKSGAFDVSDDAIGIVYPVYGFNVPEIVKRYIGQCRLKADYVFVIAAYGNADGAALHEMKKLLDANGNHADYYETLLMVDNYLPIFEMADQASKLEKKGAAGNLDRIVSEVNARTVKEESRSMFWRAMTALLGAAEGSVIKSRARRWFRVSDDCIGCGICSKVCPVSNVVQSGKGSPPSAETARAALPACTTARRGRYT